MTTAGAMLLIGGAALIAQAQKAPAMPEWLSPFTGARDQAASANGNSSYTAPAPADKVIAHYEQQMREAGVEFKTQDDGVGLSIVASAGRASAVVRIREQNGTSKVNVSYAVTPVAAVTPAATAQQIAPLDPPVQAAPASTHAEASKRIALSPYSRLPFNWVMQSADVGANPKKYAAYYWVAATNAIVEKPLGLPSGGTIVDVFPEDCEFKMRDETGHSFTFKERKEAVGRALEPGSWSLFPVKCSGVDVWVR